MSSFKALLIALVIGLLSVPALAADPGLTQAQKDEVEAIVRELLTKKEPEIIIKAAEAAQSKMEKAAAEKGQEAISKNLDKLLNDPTSPVGGNPKGDVTVVQFFDYSCGYCKMTEGHVEKLLDEDKNVRIVYKEFPILGDASVKMAETALAAVKQGKYLPFHNALLKAQKHLTESEVFDMAKSVGLDVEKLKKDMEDPKIQEILKANHELADKLEIRGTPSFVIGGRLFPGALQLEQLKDAVAEARTAAKK